MAHLIMRRLDDPCMSRQGDLPGALSRSGARRSLGETERAGNFLWPGLGVCLGRYCRCGLSGACGPLPL